MRTWLREWVKWHMIGYDALYVIHEAKKEMDAATRKQNGGDTP